MTKRIDITPAPEPLTTGKTVLYSVGDMGASVVYSFANYAFPLFLGAYPVPNWAVGLLAQERSLVGAVRWLLAAQVQRSSGAAGWLPLRSRGWPAGRSPRSPGRCPPPASPGGCPTSRRTR